jgi:hypothetical protein
MRLTGYSNFEPNDRKAFRLGATMSIALGRKPLNGLRAYSIKIFQANVWMHI